MTPAEHPFHGPLVERSFPSRMLPVEFANRLRLPSRLEFLAAPIEALGSGLKLHLLLHQSLLIGKVLSFSIGVLETAQLVQLDLLPCGRGRARLDLLVRLAEEGAEEVPDRID